MMKKIWPPLMVVILFLLIWQASVWWWNLPQWLLPGPLSIANEGVNVFPRLTVHILSTIKTSLIGFSSGVSVGILLALILFMLPGFKQAFYPLLILSQNVPIIALAPLLIIWFGYGLLPKVIVITLVCFFPIAIAMLDGLSQTDRTMLNYMKMIGASRSQILLKLQLPHALPFLFSGLKISATYSVMGAVIAEWLGAKNGIGVFMTLSSASFRTDRVFVSIFIIVLLSICMFGIIVTIERWLTPWASKKGERSK